MLIFAQNKGHGINQKLVDKKEKKTVDGSQKVSKYDFLEGAGERDKEDRGGRWGVGREKEQNSTIEPE